MKTSIFAVLREGKKELQRIALGNAIIDNNGCITARRYNELKRILNSAHPQAQKNQHWSMETADGRCDTFGGYPARENVRFDNWNIYLLKFIKLGHISGEQFVTGKNEQEAANNFLRNKDADKFEIIEIKLHSSNFR